MLAMVLGMMMLMTIISYYAFLSTTMRIKIKLRLKIYSLKSDSWRSLDDCHSRFAAHKGAPSCHGIFVGHSVHWLVSDKDGLGIVYIFAFHFGTEKFHGVPHPRFPDKNVLVNMRRLRGEIFLRMHLFVVFVRFAWHFYPWNPWSSFLMLLIQV